MAWADMPSERGTVQAKPQDAYSVRTLISRGTRSSNPVPSSGESAANPVLSREFALLGREAAVFRGETSGLGRQRHAGRGNIWPKGGDISVGPYSSTAPPVVRFATQQSCYWGSRSIEAEHPPLLVPGKRQTRMRQQLVRSQIARLVPVEDGLGDIRGEIAEADKPREIGWAHTLALRECGKRHTAAVDECGIEPARFDQQLDQPRIAFGCRKRVGSLDQHLDFVSTAAQSNRQGQDLSFVIGHARQWRHDIEE